MTVTTESPESEAASLVDRIVAGDRAAIAKLITKVESGGGAAATALSELYRRGGHAYSVGLTGSPGAGKSSLTDRLIGKIRSTGSSVGVLAIDPSSPFSGGAILGDRVRMQDHATDDAVFIRSMATRGHLGGLSLYAPEAMRILDAAGMDYVLVETVGVGQIEVDVVRAVDTTVVVVNPGWGDSVQAAKAGLLEIADVFAVNKADRDGADQTVVDLEQMIEMSGSAEWNPPIVRTVATSGEGTDQLWDAIMAHRAFLEESGRLDEERAARVGDEIRRTVSEIIASRARKLCSGPEFDALCARVAAREIDPYEAATEILHD